MKKEKFLLAALLAVLLLICGSVFAAAAETGSETETETEDDDLLRVDGALYSGYYMDGSGVLYLVSDGVSALKSGTVSATAEYYSESTGEKISFAAQTVYVDGNIYTGYYEDSAGKLYKVTDGARETKNGTLSAGTKYYSYSDETTLKLSKQTVFVSGKAYTGYYEDSTGKLYTVKSGTRTAKSGTVSAGTKYYSYNSSKTLTLSKQTVFVSGKKYTGYYEDSEGKLYKVTSGTRTAKSGTLAKGTKYYSYNSGKTLTLSKQTVFVNGKKYTGYYMDSAGKLYKVTSGTRTLKTGTVSKGTKYYSYDSGKTLTLSKNTVYVSGKKYTGYYKDSGGKMYKVSSGTRTLKSGTVSAGTKYYSYNSGKTLTLSKQTVFVNGKAYTGYYEDSSARMYSVKSGTRTAFDGTLAKGTKYYSYNSGKTLTLDDSYVFVSGYYKNTWKKIDGTWCYYDSSGKLKFESNVLHTAWETAQTMSSDTDYIILVDTSNTRTMIFEGSKGSWTPVYEWLCTPGKSSTPTVKGTFTVKAKGYSFGTSSYTCYYYTQFYGNYLFHSVLYNAGTFNVQDGRLGQQLSHGCVRLSLDNAKWIYDNIPKGTKVYVY